MYRSALVSGFVNILVFFKPLDVIRHLIASRHNQPNAFGAKLLVPTSLLLPNWKTLLSNYLDSIVVDFLSYGWPINYTAPTFPASSLRNSPGACVMPCEFLEESKPLV